MESVSKEKCKKCKGEGYVEFEYGWGQCPDCGGYGYVRLQEGEDSDRAADDSADCEAGKEGGGTVQGTMPEIPA